MNLHQVIAAYIGAALAFFAALFTGWAAWAAAKAGKAAVDAIHAERAWITYSTINITRGINTVFNGVDHPEIFGFALDWRNTGRNPAIKVDVFAVIQILGVDDPIPEFSAYPYDSERSGVFGPGMGGSSAIQWVGGDALEAFKRRDMRFIFYSKVTYEAALSPGVIRCSEACIELSVNGETERNGEPVPYFSQTAVGSQNTAT